MIAPDHPGDAVCARHVVELISRRGRTALLCREQLAGLFVGLPVESFPYRLTVSETKPALAAHSGPDTTTYDLLCDVTTGELCSSLPGPSVGVPDPARYDYEVPWTLSAPDDTHYVVRLTRYLNDRRAARVFDESEWRRSHFRRTRTPSRQYLALAPGCGRANTAKRWPMAGWRELATWAAAQGMSPVWFVGPDETELLEECRSLGGEVVTGDWSEVVQWHKRCACGVTNDTVHLHIRAHCGVSTVGIFLVSSALHWGSYPNGTTYCLTLAANGPTDNVGVVLGALAQMLGPP